MEEKLSHYQRNKQVYNERAKRWNAANPEKRRAIVKKWDNLNIDNVKERRKRRSNRLRNAEGSHTAKQWRELLIKFNFTCAYCGAKNEDGKLVKDHIYPISKGGRNDIYNIVPSCSICNCKKGNRLTEEFISKLMCYL